MEAIQRREHVYYMLYHFAGELIRLKREFEHTIHIIHMDSDLDADVMASLKQIDHALSLVVGTRLMKFGPGSLPDL